MTDPFDRSIPGYTELSEWPKQPGDQPQILWIGIYRDGGTVGVTVAGKHKDIEFFFDRVLGRLCYGEYESKKDAGYFKRGSKFEKEVYAYMEAARKQLDIADFDVADIRLFNECFKKAKVYSDV